VKIAHWQNFFYFDPSIVCTSNINTTCRQKIWIWTHYKMAIYCCKNKYL